MAIKSKKSLAVWGFTLIELMVVISIIAILSSLGFTNYAASQKRTRDGKRQTDLEQIRTVLEMCRADTGSYLDILPAAGQPLVCGGSTYMSAVPADPVPGRSYYYSGSTNSYILCAALEIGGEIVSGCGSCGTTCNYKVTNP